MPFSDTRPGQEQAPWRDPYGWDETLRHAMIDSPQGWSNYKRSTVYIPESLLLPQANINMVVTRDADGNITAFLEWIDEFNKSVRVKVDGRVINRIHALAKNLQKENRSRSGKEAAVYRKTKRDDKAEASNPLLLSTDKTDE